MPLSIALAGKGGTGKTTIAGILIKYLISKNKTPILAVDADANANLNEVLGLKVSGTLGSAREEMKRGDVPNGMTKDTFISMKLEQSVIEEDNFDLVVMGQPEGSGCYCAANTLLTGFLEKLTKNYPYIVIDNEAGMEHISRLTTKNVDILLIICDTSRRSLQAGLRIHHLTKELKINIGNSFLIINKTKNPPSNEILEMIHKNKLEFAGTIPEDEEFYRYDLKGYPTIKIEENNAAIQAAYDIFDIIIK